MFLSASTLSRDSGIYNGPPKGEDNLVSSLQSTHLFLCVPLHTPPIRGIAELGKTSVILYHTEVFITMAPSTLCCHEAKLLCHFKVGGH